jgi:hypothetical protein
MTQIQLQSTSSFLCNLLCKINTVFRPKRTHWGLCQAWEAWNALKPLLLDNKKSLTWDQRRAKDIVDQKFVSYLSVLRCTGVLRIPVRVFLPHGL